MQICEFQFINPGIDQSIALKGEYNYFFGALIGRDSLYGRIHCA